MSRTVFRGVPVSRSDSLDNPCKWFSPGNRRGSSDLRSSAVQISCQKSKSSYLLCSQSILSQVGCMCESKSKDENSKGQSPFLIELLK